MSRRRDTLLGTAFGFGAALAYATSTVLVRQGLSDMMPPLVGSALALLAGFIGILVIRVRDLKTIFSQDRRAVGFFLIAGVMGSLGIVSSYYALSLAPVVVVSPLQSTNPLFALLGAYLFLGQLEKVTPRLVLGVVLVVAGVVLITMGRTA